jgi:hypothetical protein
VRAMVAMLGAGPGSAGTAATFGIRVAAPVDAFGRLTHARVVAGVPFRVRIELSATGVRGTAAVVYDLELPTGIHLAGVQLAPKPLPLHGRSKTSRCLRACTIGWDTSRTPRLFVYYALVVPGPGDFVLGASISGTNRHDANPTDDRGSTSVLAVSPRVTLGAPRLETGTPRAGRDFAISIPVLLNGRPVTPDFARCVATVGGVTLRGIAARRVGEAGCTWALPRGTAGPIRVSVTVVARSLRASGAWLFAV